MNSESNYASTLLAHIHQPTFLDALNRIAQERGRTDCCGGVLAIASLVPHAGINEFASLSIGTPMQKFGRYARNAAEKINRLYQRRAEGHDDIAASTSADESNPDESARTYGGAIYFTGIRHGKLHEVYISFSGAPPEVDEAIAFVLGQQLGFKAPAYENPLISIAQDALSHVVRWA